MKPTQRDSVEQNILENFDESVAPLSPTDIPGINELKDGSFGYGYLAMQLYANGYNDRGFSNMNPGGLLYNDGENVFGVGFFRKELSEEDDDGHLFITAPRGPNCVKALTAFIEQVRKLDLVPETSIYIRNLLRVQYAELRAKGFEAIDSDPWHPDSPSEDETYQHSRVKIGDVLDEDEQEIKVKPLQQKKVKRKTLRAFDRFRNFLERNELEFVLEPYDSSQTQAEAEEVIRTHFSTLKKPVGSTPEDYLSLLNNFPNERNGKDVFGYIGYLVSDKFGKIPVAVYIGEDVGNGTVAIYSSFALRNIEGIDGEISDTKGLSAISQYCHVRIFDVLRKYGIEFVDLGGSETESLDNFKKGLGASEVKTYWAVSKN